MLNDLKNRGVKEVLSDRSIHIDWLFDEKGLRNEQK